MKVRAHRNSATMNFGAGCWTTSARIRIWTTRKPESRASRRVLKSLSTPPKALTPQNGGRVDMPEKITSVNFATPIAHQMNTNYEAYKGALVLGRPFRQPLRSLPDSERFS